jgi:hypothetical protein
VNRVDLKTPKGLADVAWIWSEYKIDQEGAREEIARLLGLELEVQTESRPTQVTGRSEDEAPKEAPTPRPEARSAPVGFWRVVKVEGGDQDEDGGEPEWVKTPPLTPARLRDATRPAEHARPLPLLSQWSRLWPFLRREASERAALGPVDAERLVRDLAKLRPIRRIPRREIPRWGRIHLLRDCSQAMAPFHDDMNDLERRLQRLSGAHRLTTFVFPSGLDEPGFQRERPGEDLHATCAYEPQEGVTVVALSNLGASAGAPETARALADTGRQIRRRGGRALALAPCSLDRLDAKLFGAWRVARWDLGQRLRVAGRRGVSKEDAAGRTRDARREEARRSYLRLLSPMVRLDPELLRRVRALLDPGLTDGGMESEVCIGRAEPRRSREAWRQEDRALRESLVRLLWWVHGDRPEILAEELHTIKSLDEEMLGVVADLSDVDAEEGDVDQEDRAAQCAAAIVAALRGGRWRALGFSEAGLMGYLARMQARLPPEAFEQVRIGAIWVLRHLKEDGTLDEEAVPPGGIPWHRLGFLVKQGERRQYALEQVEDSLCVAGGHSVGFPSPLGEITANSDSLFMQTSSVGRKPIQSQWNVSDGAARALVAIEQGVRHVISSTEAAVTLEQLRKPAWAKGIGRDRRGLFIDVQDGWRVYWVPPGYYQAEADDGGVESVLLSKGRWLNAAGGDSFLDERGRLRWDWKSLVSDDGVGRDEQGLYEDIELSEGVVQRFRFVPSGSFMMGSPDGEPGRDDDETLHEVELSQGSWMADTACTQSLWEAVMGENPSRFKGADRPVENVSWEDCQGFVRKLNKSTPGLDFRLPTEAQWEYACRAGTETPFSFGENMTPEQVNYDGNYPYAGGEKGEYREETVAVRSLPPNAWGLYEMHGNVYEWCADWFGEYPEGRVIDPAGPPEGGGRVLRGGSWINDGGYCRSAYRLWNHPGDRHDIIGFRLSRGQASPGTTPEAASGAAPEAPQSAAPRAEQRDDDGGSWFSRTFRKKK